ncbi:MAG: hypothetical protein J1D89_00085 [Agathobacter sp.]|nr:hypothetical protein [Agathobacter sp.]
MTALEMILILIGVAFILVSFFVEEKLTHKDLERLTSLSEKEMKVIVERQLKEAESVIDDSLTEAVGEVADVTKRALEKVTNEKIMAINEYSDTVIESMNKTHSEIIFLYNMLNDKHVELTQFADQLRDFSKQVKSSGNDMLYSVAEAARELESSLHRKLPPLVEPEEFGASGSESEDLFEDAEEPHEKREPQEMRALREQREWSDEREERANHNESILALRDEGVPDVEIARQLGLGLGEVRLVIDLYRGA